MHVIVGAIFMVGVFVSAMQYMSEDFSGFWNMYSAILLGGMPIGLVVFTYRFATIWAAIRGLFATFSHNPEADRQRLSETLIAFAKEVRRERTAAASAILENEADPIFRHLGQHILQNTEENEIASDAVILGRRELHDFQRAEKVLSSLGDFAPAMGMIGTVIGLIQLLANMSDFEKLGPGMAIALLTTFYGLMLAHLLYLPLARLVADYGVQRSQNINMVIDGMLKLSRRRPIHEVQQMLGVEPSAVDGSRKAVHV
jgi:chemotaxis protein MotA